MGPESLKVRTFYANLQLEIACLMTYYIVSESNKLIKTSLLSCILRLSYVFNELVTGVAARWQSHGEEWRIWIRSSFTVLYIVLGSLFQCFQMLSNVHKFLKPSTAASSSFFNSVLLLFFSSSPLTTLPTTQLSSSCSLVSTSFCGACFFLTRTHAPSRTAGDLELAAECLSVVLHSCLSYISFFSVFLRCVAPFSFRFCFVFFACHVELP